MKEKYRVKCLHRYCDDNVMLARSKAEALFLIRAYERESAKVGLVVKANSFLHDRHFLDFSEVPVIDKVIGTFVPLYLYCIPRESVRSVF